MQAIELFSIIASFSTYSFCSDSKEEKDEVLVVVFNEFSMSALSGDMKYQHLFPECTEWRQKYQHLFHECTEGRHEISASFS